MTDQQARRAAMLVILGAWTTGPGHEDPTTRKHAQAFSRQVNRVFQEHGCNLFEVETAVFFLADLDAVTAEIKARKFSGFQEHFEAIYARAASRFARRKSLAFPRSPAAA